MRESVFVVDDIQIARRFVKSLNREVRKLRFSNFDNWEPDRIVVVVVDGVAVAMADCKLSFENNGANVSLLSKPSFGAYALKALIHLKSLVPISFWYSTLRVPTLSTMAISKRYLHAVYDQATWEVSNSLMLRNGNVPYFYPISLAVCDVDLKEAGLPLLKHWDVGSKNAVLRAAKNPGQEQLTLRNGTAISAPLLMSLAFELAEVPFSIRQGMTRMMIFGLAGSGGIMLPVANAKKLMGRNTIQRFGQQLDKHITDKAIIPKLFTFDGSYRPAIA